MEAFQLGEKVIYPQFGLGTIAGVIEKQVDGANFNFYRLEFPIKQMEILVPVTRAKESGLRKIMSSAQVDVLIDCISSTDQEPKPQQWHRWRKKTLEQLKTGDPQEIAKIFCHLRRLEDQKGLSFTERKILLQVERMLIAEIAVAKKVSEKDAERLLSHPLNNGKPKNPRKRASG